MNENEEDNDSENNENNNYGINIASDFDSYLTINFIEKIIYIIFLLL